MNILIAGGSGFIGSKLVEKFSREGHSIVIVDIVEPNMKLRLNSRISFEKINILSDGLEEVFKDKYFDIIVHSAHGYSKEI